MTRESEQEQPDETGVDFRLRWVDPDDIPVLAASHFHIMGHRSDAVLLRFGYAAPPALIGTHEEQMQQVEAIEFIDIRSRARVSISRDTAAELHRQLSELLGLATGENGE